ncbi:hypothetical protein BVG16_16360 [Paenibacillus selenitireducens]|uniref:Uncharacterized protein n=1 Tax=Paenibacillus selenitireducens TaxID=1324314 RepID=A0A1T2XAW5_9BACL|nr:hypothetical protein [Paenibacillus selenitireducens]OPA76743.1 hypothetical protein BVG16_16360 [Paenibacillus selenitireducens]
MSAVLLLDAVSRFVRKTVEEYSAAQGKNGVYKHPKVFEWYLPFKNPKIPEDTDFPYVVARIVNGKDAVNQRNDAECTVDIALSFGVYSEATDEEGFKQPDGGYDLLNLMEHVRITLLNENIIDKKYEIQRPYVWEIPEEQPYPLWVGLAQTQWKFQSIEPQIKDIDIYANRFAWEK